MELETRWGEKKMRKDLSSTSFPSPTLSPLSPLSPLSLSAPCFLLTPHLSLHHLSLSSCFCLSHPPPFIPPSVPPPPPLPLPLSLSRSLSLPLSLSFSL